MKITIDRNGKTTPTNFTWQFGVGSDHAFQLHRADMCEHVRLAHEELGFKYIRFHGIFDDDMLCVQQLSDCNLFHAMPHGKEIAEVNFLQVAKVYDNVLACGMKPFVELSFMPSALASGKRTGLRYKNNITMPKSLAKWREFITAFIKFLLHRYGKEEVASWYFEVWNEPDLGIFFKGKQQDYFRLYEATARAIKKVDKDLRVGGPSTSAVGSGNLRRSSRRTPSLAIFSLPITTRATHSGTVFPSKTFSRSCASPKTRQKISAAFLPICGICFSIPKGAKHGGRVCFPNSTSVRERRRGKCLFL